MAALEGLSVCRCVTFKAKCVPGEVHPRRPWGRKSGSNEEITSKIGTSETLQIGLLDLLVNCGWFRFCP